MTRMPGKRILLEMFRAEGVEFMFGNPGTSEAPMIDIMREYTDIRYILALQEGSAVGMADGYWRATGKTPLVSLHIDNGMANGLSLMIDQKNTYAPMVLTVGNKDIRKMAAGRADLADMARPFAKWSTEITAADQTASVIRRAFQQASSHPYGPVFVAVSANAFDEQAEAIIEPSIHTTPPAADETAILEAARSIADAEHPILILGSRAGEYEGAKAMRAAVRLAETAGMRVYGHYSPSLDFPANHPLWQGKIQMRSPGDLEVVRTADVIAAIGCPVFEDFFQLPEPILGKNTKVIHIDSAADEIGKSERTDVGIVAAPVLAMAQLEDALKDVMTGRHTEAAIARSEDAKKASLARRLAFTERAAAEWKQRPMSSAVMGKALADALPPDAILFNDGISCSPDIFEAVSPSEHGSYFGSRGQAIGWGLGATIGLKVGAPDRPVIGVVGDGSAMMTIQALWTAVSESIPAVFVICNNSSYRILKINMNHYHRLINQPVPESYFAMDFYPPIDFAAQARAYGARGERVESPEELAPKMRNALDSGEPTVLDVIISDAL